MPAPENAMTDTLIRFDRLRERLILGGVARRHVSRTLKELRDHYDDAIDGGLAQGLAREDAAEAAWRRLGGEDDIVASVLARPELRSLPARFPRAVFGAGPLLLWIVGTILSGIMLVGILKGLQLAGVLPPPGTPEPEWIRGPLQGIVFFYVKILPVLIGVAMVAAAVRHSLAPGWALAGGIAVAALSVFARSFLTFLSAAGEKGELSVGFGLSAEELPGAAALILAYAVLIASAAGLAYLRRTRRTA